MKSMLKLGPRRPTAGSLSTPASSSKPPLSSASSSLLNSLPLRRRPRASARAAAARAARPVTRAMINIDLSPASILGASLVLAGVVLYQIRASKPAISKDYDVVVSSVSVLVGGILIFQGWRLDPLLMFGQLLTAGVAVTFAAEALKLRSVITEKEADAELRPPAGMESEFPSSSYRSASDQFPDTSMFANDVATKPGGRFQRANAPPPPGYGGPMGYPPPAYDPRMNAQGQWQGQGMGMGGLPAPREDQYVSNLWNQQQQDQPAVAEASQGYSPQQAWNGNGNGNGNGMNGGGYGDSVSMPQAPTFYADSYGQQPPQQPGYYGGYQPMMENGGAPTYGGAGEQMQGGMTDSQLPPPPPSQAPQRRDERPQGGRRGGARKDGSSFIDAVDDWE